MYPMIFVKEERHRVFANNNSRRIATPNFSVSSKNPVQHSRTKHIDIFHHFLRDHEAKGDISLHGVRSEVQLADIFTKPLDESTFVRLRNELNLLDAANVM